MRVRVSLAPQPRFACPTSAQLEIRMSSQQERESRRLSISDFAPAQERQIRENPYGILGVLPDSSFPQIRMAYIGLSRKYLADLINPVLPSLSIGQVRRSFSPEECLAVAEDLRRALSDAPDNTLLADLFREQERLAQALLSIRALAHERMVLINRAYEEIKARVGKKEFMTIAGYTAATCHDKVEGSDYQLIEMEGHGQIHIYPDHYEYWVAGPYLLFDWGPPPEHPCYEDDYRQAIPIKHLFAHMEIEKGQEPSPILLEPFFDCFKLNRRQQGLYLKLVGKREPTRLIMKALGISEPEKTKTEDLMPTRFERQTNQLLNLNPHEDGTLSSPWSYLDFSEYGFKAKITEDERLSLRGYRETVFSETDLILLQTLAYGTLLK